MRRLALGALVLAAAAALAGEQGAEAPGPVGPGLAALLPDAPRGWQRLADPVAPPEDAELRALGLLASVAHHYTRATGPVEVCTLELWSFQRAAQVETAQRALAPLGEWTRRAGPLLVVARSRRLERHVGTRHELLPECEALAESARARAVGQP